ncbi:MAG TPA: sugar transferase [Gemmatimonadaceae bacterium]|nr:sugar transferase [Gemmatimonadaceae bacterium]
MTDPVRRADARIRRAFDVASAAIGLVVAAPVLLVAAVGVRLSSPGPVLFRTRRLGRGGCPFLMYKLRTMHVDHGPVRSRITLARDPRIFPFGVLLRRLKIDELPQLVNVLKGDMAIVGPRPEDPELVARHYTPEQRETLAVRPGLTSPGSLYYELHAQSQLDGPDAESRYAAYALPLKLAIDLVYVRRATLWSDLGVIARTLVVLAGALTGRRRFADPPELREAHRLLGDLA